MLRSAHSSRALALEIETLESRRMLAGEVRAVLSGSNLTLTGDAQDNLLEVSTDSSGNFIVDGFNTLITFNGVTAQTHVIDAPNNFELGRLTINLKGGNDAIGVSSFFADRIVVNLGAGNDDFDVIDVQIVNLLRVSGGSGYDFVTAIDGNIDKNIVFVAESVQMDNYLVGGNVTVRSGASDDYFYVQDSDIFGRVSVVSGGGNDSIEILNTRFDDSARFVTGGGNDTTRICDSTFSGPATFIFGAGNDTLNYESAPVFEDSLLVNGGAGDDFYNYFGGIPIFLGTVREISIEADPSLG